MSSLLIHHSFCPLLGVLSLVTVQPTAAPVAKQLLPKTLGPSNVNITAHMQHVPHMVSKYWLKKKNAPREYELQSLSIYICARMNLKTSYFLVYM